MKRSGPPARRTPMGRGKPLQRTAWRPQPSPDRPIKPVQADRRRRARVDGDDAPRIDHSIPWSEVRLIIYARALGRCEVCGRQLNIANMEGHHRQTRAVGVDCPGNALALCADCHHGPQVHAGPEAARAAGRIVSRHVIRSRVCSTAPVFLYGIGWAETTCGGTIIPCADPCTNDQHAHPDPVDE